jgi:hypothetical protein
MHSLRIRLLALWLMLAVSGAVTAVLLVEFYQQSTNALVSRAEDAVARDRYAFFVTVWRDIRQSEVDDALKRALVGVAADALSRAPGVEGGFWQAGDGSLAYASGILSARQGAGKRRDVMASIPRQCMASTSPA